MLLWWLQSDTGIPVEPIVVTLLYYLYCFCVCELGRQFALRCITKDYELQKILIEFFGALFTSAQRRYRHSCRHDADLCDALRSAADHTNVRDGCIYY